MILVMKQHLMRKVSGREGRGEMREREEREGKGGGRGREEVIIYKEGERADWEEKGGERKEGGREGGREGDRESERRNIIYSTARDRGGNRRA